MLQAASQYRHSRASLYKTGALPEGEPEYVPWTGENSKIVMFMCFKVLDHYPLKSLSSNRKYYTGRCLQAYKVILA